MNDVRERLAAYAHEAWVRWMEYLLGKCQPTGGDGSVAIPAAYMTNLERLMAVPYWDMPESSKESDRREADRMLAIMEEVT